MTRTWDATAAAPRAKRGERGELEPIGVLIADDDPEMLAALTAIVASDCSLRVVGTAADGAEAVALAPNVVLDVAIVDWRMPAGGGEAATRGILSTCPGAKVVALSAERDRRAVISMLRAGASSYIVKGAGVGEILGAIHLAHDGKATLSADVAGAVVGELVQHLDQEEEEGERLQRQRSRIRDAIDHGGLTMAFQPLYDLNDGSVAGVEALARFVLPPRRPAAVWFAEANAVGLGLDLELAAVRCALGHVEMLPPKAFMSINASPEVAGSRAFADLLYRSRPGSIVVEVTEHAAVEDYATLNAALTGLREMGVRLAIDDAGAGFASLSHILRLDPEFIKLDFVLCRDIDKDRARETLARGLVSFGRELGATVVAEGIETWDEVRTLRSVGVRYGQGFRLRRPGHLSPGLGPLEELRDR